MKNKEIIDNRFLVANMIACEKDTPRAVDPDMFKMVFDIQEKVKRTFCGHSDNSRLWKKPPGPLTLSNKPLPQ